ncbi:MAG: ATP-binding cassette domain-containing protein [Aliifodinibius sp.]|nr:ABC transporter ATP-binding protein [candidate division Zixibacteria bacterium]NIS47264.1 ABC transporter ATP-binding protein [candidate division Zixibacteria bacterium]NIT58220.1 ABC transporter ATP-binding protein [Fodinibius sp.]NIV07470.1 ATP-binding cassette domain-containing protein [candidate division Zixibacteria bacterium]NIY26802.1 ATP-binding cassette domain-containing protein [Fodinibius sp.]
MTVNLTNANVIQIENVSVRYRVPKERMRTIKEVAIRWIRRELGYKDFWALKDVNLSLKSGEIMGVVGHNGAGKSTMLKLVAKILKPTSGRVLVKGKVAPLLGFGAGFHLELTGRENVYLNGALLGFSHAEMDEKFDRIVDFAEIWDFIDAPLRTYSTGMKARLGFAVATDVEPDILLIDEALAVGDTAFQEKSSERMRQFYEKGVAILLVSHNMASIQSLCHKVAWIDHGELKMLGDTDEVVEAYQTDQLSAKRSR